MSGCGEKCGGPKTCLPCWIYHSVMRECLLAMVDKKYPEIPVPTFTRTNGGE